MNTLAFQLPFRLVGPPVRVDMVIIANVPSGFFGILITTARPHNAIKSYTKKQRNWNLMLCEHFPVPTVASLGKIGHEKY